MERCCGAEVWSWVSKMCRLHAADMVALSTWSHHKHQCRLLWGSAQVERSMCGGSAGPCFADVCWVVSGADTMGLGVQNVHSTCARQSRHGRHGRSVMCHKRNVGNGTNLGGGRYCSRLPGTVVRSHVAMLLETSCRLKTTS